MDERRDFPLVERTLLVLFQKKRTRVFHGLHEMGSMCATQQGVEVGGAHNMGERSFKEAWGHTLAGKRNGVTYGAAVLAAPRKDQDRLICSPDHAVCDLASCGFTEVCCSNDSFVQRTNKYGHERAITRKHGSRASVPRWV